jgi:hypothetical protein
VPHISQRYLLGDVGFRSAVLKTQALKFALVSGDRNRRSLRLPRRAGAGGMTDLFVGLYRLDDRARMEVNQPAGQLGRRKGKTGDQHGRDKVIAIERQSSGIAGG